MTADVTSAAVGEVVVLWDSGCQCAEDMGMW